jgi:DNA-binding transcriptional MerR regulator
LTGETENKIPSDGKEVGKYTMSVTVNLTGLAAHKIRRLEEAGLCSPARTDCKQRLYSDNDISLIKKISNLMQKGINTEGVKVILSMEIKNPDGKKPQTG